MANALKMHALTDLSKDLKGVDKKFASAVRKNLRAGVQTGGTKVLTEVRRRASWSTRIPNATSLSVRYSLRGASVLIRVNHNKAPHARGLELGNKTTFSEAVINANGGFKVVNGRKVAVNRRVYSAMKTTHVGVGRALRHPVYDSKRPPTRVGEQATRPFFFPGITASQDGVEQTLELAAIQAAKDAGFS